MAQYIDKNDLVKAIDRQKIGYNVDGKHTVEYDITRKILDIINALEVKEVDLDTAIQIMCNSDYYKRHIKHSPYVSDTINYTAKYFFELGLKTQKGE